MLSLRKEQCELRFVDAVVINLLVVQPRCVNKLVRWEQRRASLP